MLSVCQVTITRRELVNVNSFSQCAYGQTRGTIKRDDIDMMVRQS